MPPTATNSPGTGSSPANGRNRNWPTTIRPSGSTVRSLSPAMPSPGAYTVRVVPSAATWITSRPDITSPPSAWRAIPPTPRRFATTVVTSPVAGDHSWTPPPSTSANTTPPPAVATGASASW
jgi:hypothetical protein